MKSLSSPSPPTVLLVDDHDQARTAVERLLLKTYKIRILHATSTLGAYEVLEANAIDVVVADVRMQGPSGLVLLAYVRDNYPTIRRVLLTGFSAAGYALSGLADVVLDKSMDSWLIVDTIAHLAFTPRD